MRTDYPLYIVAIVCFIIAVYAYAAPLTRATDLYLYVLAVLGIVFLGLGYITRPKQATISSAVSAPSKPSELPPTPPESKLEEETEK